MAFGASAGRTSIVDPLAAITRRDRIGPTRGRPWSATAARAQLRRLAVQAGVRRRFAPHQLRHAHAVEMAREGVPLNVIQRQLGHADLGITSVYLQGIDNTEVIAAVRGRPAPTMPASAGLTMHG
ncbi:MAG: tyrosine-type recombinase/integrase [Solirubrobacterales bacterium]